MQSATCHPELPMRAKGLCANCYAAWCYRKRCFLEVVVMLRPMLYQKALAITENVDDANDVVQSTLMKAYDKLGQWRRDAKLSTWLVAICRNEALMWVRKERHLGMKQPPTMIYLDHLPDVAAQAVEREISLGETPHGR